MSRINLLVVLCLVVLNISWIQSMPSNSTEGESSGASTIDPKTIKEGLTETADRCNETVKLTKNEYEIIKNGTIFILVLLVAYPFGWLSFGLYQHYWKGVIIEWAPTSIV